MTGVDFLAALIHYVTFFHFFCQTLSHFSQWQQTCDTQPTNPTQLFFQHKEKMFYTFPKKPIPQMKKSFCVCFEEPITWPNPKKFLIFFEEKNTLEENILLYFLVKITTLIRKKKHIFQTQLTSCNYQKKHFSNKEFLTLA